MATSSVASFLLLKYTPVKTGLPPSGELAMPTFFIDSKSSVTSTSSVFLFVLSSNNASGYVFSSSFLNLNSIFFVSTLSSVPMSENVTSPVGSFLTISDKTLAFTSVSPSTSVFTPVLAFKTMSRSEPTTSNRSSLVFRYMPCKEGVEGLGSTTLETEETTSFRALVFILNFNLIPYRFNNNKAVENV